MASKDALQLVDYLTSTMPRENQSFDDYMNEALATLAYTIGGGSCVGR